MFLFSTVIAVSLSADPQAGNTMKGLVKDIGVSSTTSDGGVTSTLVNGIDISKLPFTQDSVKKIVLSFQPQIQSCYEEILAAKEKAIEGTLKTAFTITGDGYVTKARIDKKASSLKDQRLHDCVVAVLSTMQFPAPPDGKARPIDFPFKLTAVH